jgi:uncharacterized RDD family membrane protein YckC
MDNDLSVQHNPYQAPEAAVEYALPPGEFELAERGTRLLAIIVEFLILAGLIVVCFFIIVILGGLGLSLFRGLNSSSDYVYLVILGIILLIACPIGYAILNIYLLYKNGQTVGKYFFGIKIVRTDGSRAGVWRILLLRWFVMWLIKSIPVIGFIITWLDPLLIFRESHKCLHDDIADTIVIKA